LQQQQQKQQMNAVSQRLLKKNQLDQYFLKKQSIYNGLTNPRNLNTQQNTHNVLEKISLPIKTRTTTTRHDLKVDVTYDDINGNDKNMFDDNNDNNSNNNNNKINNNNNQSNNNNNNNKNNMHTHKHTNNHQKQQRVKKRVL